MADSQRMSPERRRLTCAVLLSLVIHASLLSLTFGGQGLWLPGFGFRWQDRGIEARDLRVEVVPAQVKATEPAVTLVAVPVKQAWVEQPVARWPALTPSVHSAPTPRRNAAAIMREAHPTGGVDPSPDAASGGTPAPVPMPAERPGDTAPTPVAAAPVIALDRTDEDTWVVPATPGMPSPDIAAAPSAASPETAIPSLRDGGDEVRARVDQEEQERAVEPAKPDPLGQDVQRHAEQLEVSRQDAARQEAAREENVRLEAEREEAARQAADLQEVARHVAAQTEAARAEAARIEAARAEAARTEAAQIEAAREAARVDAARIEDARIEAARIEAARIESARAESARAEAARAEAARIEAARVEAVRAEAARIKVAQEEDERREAVRRAIGRQLDEEADRRAAAARQSPSWGSARRYRLFGRTDPNAELILWVEAWSRKIELNMTFDMVREAAKQPHTDPLVTVAIRSDGSVESVTFVQSSGVAAIDEAIRRIVDSQRPYQVFPPDLAREYDVIELRRTWHFDMAIRPY